MGTFFLFGKYTAQSSKEISAGRTQKAYTLLRNLGGEVDSIYALLGMHDLVFIVRFPGIEGAMKASIALKNLTGISFTTAPAVPIEEFDELIEGIKWPDMTHVGP